MINELTKKHQATAQKYREEWFARGNSCEKANLDECRKYGDLVYKACGTPPPETYLEADSPLSAALIGEAMLSLDRQNSDGKKNANAFEHKLTLARMDDLIRSKARDEIVGPIAAEISSGTKEQLSKLIHEPLKDHFRVRLFQFVLLYLRNLDLKASITESVLLSTRESLMRAIPNLSKSRLDKWLAKLDTTTDRLKDHVNCVLCASHEVGYYGWFDFQFRELGVKSDGPLAHLVEFSKHCGSYFPYLEFMILQHRQAEMHIDDRGRPHNDKGMAIRYRDDTGVWAIDGIPVTEQIVMKPETLTVKDIKTQQNAEVRRIMRERFGEGRYLQETGAKVIQADFEGARKGAAPRVLMQDHENQRWLVGTDGSTGRCYYMRVPQTVNTCKEAHEAICGFKEEKILAKS